MFLSIFAATCRPNNITRFLDNLAETADDLSSFEVLLKVDEGADELIQIIETYRKQAKFRIKYLATPKLEGYYSLEVGYNELLKIADPQTYFCWLLTDEIRLETKGWDTLLKKYIKFYPDDIFRVKLSFFQSKNYIDFFECLPCPDNYALTTRKWLEITGGWGHFWGPDSWHQCVDFYLSLCKNNSYPFGIWRSFPVFEVKVGGQEAGQGIVDNKALRERAIRIWHGWQKHSTHKAQENFYKLAQRLNAHIYAAEKGIQQYVLQENLNQKTLSIFGPTDKVPLCTWKYAVPKFRLKLMLGYKSANFWHLFPSLYDFRRILVSLYRNLEATYSKFSYGIYSLINRIRRRIKKYSMISMNYIGIAFQFISKLIEFFLALPFFICRSIFKKLNDLGLPTPQFLTVFLRVILSVPINLYQGIKKSLKKGIACIASSPSSISNLLSRVKTCFKTRLSQKNTIKYFYDGKNLKQLDVDSEKEGVLFKEKTVADNSMTQ